MSVSKNSSTTQSIDEIISKEKFFIELYNNKVDMKIVESFENDIEFFSRLNIGINYHKKYSNSQVVYYIEPYEKKYGTIGFHITR